MNSTNSNFLAVISHHISIFFEKIGWSSLYDYKLAYSKNSSHIIEAFIEIGQWVINILISDNFFIQFKKIFEDDSIITHFEHPLLLSPIENQIPLLTNNFSFLYHKELHELLSELILHEVGHSRECPIDSDCFSSIIHGITTALKSKNKFGHKTLIYIANQFTDIIVNTINGIDKENRFVRNGFILYYYIELSQTANNSKDFLYFLMINIYLFVSNNKLYTLLEEKIIYQIKSDYLKDIEKLIRIFCPYDSILFNIIHRRELSESEKWKIINYISHSEHWGELSYEFAQEMIYHLPPEHDIQPNKVNYNIFTKKFQGNRDYQKEIYTKILIKQELEEIKKKRNNQKKSSSSRSKKNTVPSSYENPLKKDIKSNGEIFPGFFDIEKSSPFIIKENFFDCLYKYRLKKINFNIKQSTDSYKLPISWMNRSILSENDNPMNFDPLNTFFIPKSKELLIYKRCHPLKDKSHGIVKGEGFPNLSIVYDDSSSMDWNYLEGIGKYDAVIITIYSIFQWLSQQTFSSVIDYNLTAFSSSTRSSGWVDYYHLESFLPLLFNKEDGGTVLDPEIFTSIIKTSQKKAILLITDGEINNGSEILNILDRNRIKIHFLMIEIGHSTKMGKNLKKKGFNVFTLKNIKNLAEIALDFMNSSYQQNS